MPDDQGPVRNDNIRTGHLKCLACKTQIYLETIERHPEGYEVRTFRCPRCAGSRTLRIGPGDSLINDDANPHAQGCSTGDHGS